ncbi:MFS transporter [Streptomyces griseofuscus]|uniref:MFS transporter n=1 Tax=Streptomyces griseofuscus TaxID=146922 RepID=UPI0036CBCB34
MTHPLRLRDFRLLFASRTMSTLSDALVPTALSLAVIEVTGSATALAVVLGCALGARLLALPVAGVVADRYNTRWVAFGADLTRVATQALVAVQLIGGHPSIPLIATAQAVAGVASAVSLPNLAPLVTRAVPGPGPERQKANSLMGVAKSISQLAGPALAGALIWAVGIGWVFVLDSAAFAVSATMLLLVRLNWDRPPPGARRAILAGLVEGWAEVRARDWYWISLIAHATWNFAANILLTLGPLVAVTRLGGQGTWIAVTQAGGIGLLAGSLLAGRARPRRPILAGNLVLASYAVPLTLFAIGAPVPVLVAGYGVAMAGLGFLNPTWQTAVQTAVPQRVLARVSSYDWLVSLAAQPLGVILAPIALHAWGARLPFALTAVLVATVCVAAALAPGVRNLRLEQPADTPVDGPRSLGEPAPDKATGTA